MTDFAAKVSISVEELWKRNRYAANLIFDFHSPQTLWGKLRLQIVTKGHTRVATINSPLVPMVCGLDGSMCRPTSGDGITPRSPSNGTVIFRFFV